MRPIGGAITSERVSSCDYSVILWSVDSLDYKNAFVEGGVENIVNNVMSDVEDGDIILMHDIYENTYEASKIILKRLYDEGYEVVTVSELLGSKLEAGQKYSKR
jgi:peptidoglycan/xylan/chitin deacetylase (PgdA/CDA1 family)